MMLLGALLCSLALGALGQRGDDDWVDPYDLINYEAGTKSMKKNTEQPALYDKVSTKRREHTQGVDQEELKLCHREMSKLKKQVEKQKAEITLLSQQPICNSVLKRFLRRLLKEMQRLGLHSQADFFYDAQIKLSRQAMTEIETLLEGEDKWTTGSLDMVMSQILVDLKHHDYEAWKWRFEDTFGIELDILLKMGVLILLVVAIICTQLWSRVSWFVQFWRLFWICFFISIIWNWFYLYKIAFAKHQSEMAKMHSVNEKCTGMKKIEWSDSLREWYRSTWTLQDEPCKKYYEVLLVNPIFLVPPIKAISLTITNFITEPLKHVGQGISEFLQALLKDLPVTLQIPVFLTIVLSILVLMYGTVQAAFRYGITAPLRRPRQDPALPPQEDERPQLQRIRGYAELAGGDAQQGPQGPRQGGDDAQLNTHQIHRRPHKKLREEQARVSVETLLAADSDRSEDETDAVGQEAKPERGQRLPVDSCPRNLPDIQREAGGDGIANLAKAERVRPDKSPSKAKPEKKSDHRSRDEPNREHGQLGSQPSERKLPQDNVEDPEDKISVLATDIDTTGFPIQEVCSTTWE